MKINKELFKAKMLKELEENLKDTYKYSGIAYGALENITITIVNYIHHDNVSDNEFNLMLDLIYLLTKDDYAYKTMQFVFNIHRKVFISNLER